MRIQDSVCVVTGGASGLGRGTVEYLLAQGARVAVIDVDPIPEELVSEGVAFHAVDITDDAAVRQALDEVRSEFGAIHVAVNCAGIVKSAPTLSDGGIFPIDLFRRTIDVNLTGTFIVLARAAEIMAHNEPNGEGERGGRHKHRIYCGHRRKLQCCVCRFQGRGALGFTHGRSRPRPFRYSSQRHRARLHGH